MRIRCSRAIALGRPAGSRTGLVALMGGLLAIAALVVPAGAATGPGVPTGVMAVYEANSGGGTDIVVTWDASDPAPTLGYEVHWSVHGGQSGKTGKPPSERSVRFEDVNTSERWTFTVQAYDGPIVDGKASASSEPSAPVLIGPDPAFEVSVSEGSLVVTSGEAAELPWDALRISCLNGSVHVAGEALSEGCDSITSVSVTLDGDGADRIQADLTPAFSTLTEVTIDSGPGVDRVIVNTGNRSRSGPAITDGPTVDLVAVEEPMWLTEFTVGGSADHQFWFDIFQETFEGQEVAQNTFQAVRFYDSTKAPGPEREELPLVNGEPGTISITLDAGTVPINAYAGSGLVEDLQVSDVDASPIVSFAVTPVAMDWATSPEAPCNVGGCVATVADRHIANGVIGSLQARPPMLHGAWVGTNAQSNSFPQIDANGAFVLRAAAPHHRVDGSINLGLYRSFVPRTALANMFGVEIDDAELDTKIDALVTDGRATVGIDETGDQVEATRLSGYTVTKVERDGVVAGVEVDVPYGSFHYSDPMIGVFDAAPLPGPTGVTVTAGSTTAVVSWTAGDAAVPDGYELDGYVVEVERIDAAAAVPVRSVSEVTADVLQHEVAGLATDMPHIVTVSARFSDGTDVVLVRSAIAEFRTAAGGGGSGPPADGGRAVPDPDISVSVPEPSVPGGASTVTVETSTGPVTVTVDRAGAGMELTVRPIPSSTSPGTRLLASGYDIDLTGAGDRTATICLPVSQTQLLDAGIDHARAVVFHFPTTGDVEALAATWSADGTQLCAATASFSPFVVGQLRTDRVAGTSAVETAIAVSQATFGDGADTVFVATRRDHADVLAAGPAAVAQRAPILLSDHGSLSPATIAEIQRLAPERIVIVGGTAAVSDAVRTQLRGLASAVERLAGADRYGTAAAVAATFETGVGVVRVATGRSFADGLVAGAASAQSPGPVLLTDGTSLSEETRLQLMRLSADVIHVVGGSAAVSDTVLEEIRRLTDADVSRVAGVDRYGTAAAVARSAPAGSPAFVATGEAPWDALASAPMVAASGGTLLLTRTDQLPLVTAEALDHLVTSDITVLGGTEALSLPVELEIARRIR